MTTIAYDRVTRTIGADSRNTDNTGQVFLCNKIERLSDGRYFLGSGHGLTISKVKQWAEGEFREANRPDFDELFNEDTADNFSMSCLIISEDGDTVILVDAEMVPLEVLDEYLGVGSGGASARAALAAGADMLKAIEIAIKYDGNSGGPVCIRRIGETQ